VAKTIGLCMIVKDEAQTILRCLESVRPLIDYVVVCDTGSIDGTQQLILNWLVHAGIPGMVFDEPWQDFAHNRSSALRRLRSIDGIDYALIIDADDVLVVEPGTDLAALKASLVGDLYDVEIVLGAYRWRRAQLLSNRLPFRYRGVVHEFVEGPPGASTGDLRGLHIAAGVEGARSRNPDKYRDDALLLTMALKDEIDPDIRRRYCFYLAQSWRDAGQPVAAHSAYVMRAKMGGTHLGENFTSFYWVGKLREQFGFLHTDIVGAYLQAYEADPERAESLHGAIRYCHRNAASHQGYLIGKHALTISEPPGKMFAEPWIYDYGLLDDFAVAAYWSGHYRECLEATTRLLDENRAPEDAVERIKANRDFAVEKLA